jgi:Rod binding domain-containing protein
MSIPITNTRAKVNPTDVPLEKLATSKALTEEQKTSEMTRQFEAVLLRQILTQAQKPAFPKKGASDGVDSAIYQDMMVNNMAEKISSSRTVGLSQELGKQFSHHGGHSKTDHAEPVTQMRAHSAHANQIHNSKKVEPPIALTKAPRL